MTGEGKYVETQGTAEHGTFDRREMNDLLVLAEKGIQDSFAVQRQVLRAAGLPAL
jgi:ribonuclease PH